MITIYLDPEAELRAGGWCTCRHCVAEYPVLAEYAVDGAGNAEGIDIRLVLGPGRNEPIVEDVLGLIRAVIADRLYRAPCSRSTGGLV